MSNRLAVWALAFSLGLNIVLLGMVAHHLSQGSWPTPRAAAAPRSSPAAFTLQFDEKRLKLTPEQHDRFQEINERWMEEEKAAKTKGVERISKLSKLLVQDSATTATLRPVFNEIRDHSDEFFVRLTRALREYRAELKPEQRVVFNRMLAERFNALQRFTRQRTFEYEQRIMQSKQHGKKSGKGGKGKNEKKGDGKSDGKAKKTGEKKAQGQGTAAPGNAASEAKGKTTNPAPKAEAASPKATQEQAANAVRTSKP